jgi:hypothetical protein
LPSGLTKKIAAAVVKRLENGVVREWPPLLNGSDEEISVAVRAMAFRFLLIHINKVGD